MTIIRILFSGLTSFFGFSAFIAFMVLKNYPCSVLGLLAGTVDAISLLLHILVRGNKLTDWYSQSHLKSFTRLSIFMFVVGVVATIYFATKELITLDPIMPIESSKVLPLIWSVVLVRGAFFLFYYSLSYQTTYYEADGERQRLLQNTESNPGASQNV